jgi:hypothetical protein
MVPPSLFLMLQWLKTVMPMVDVAIYTIKYTKRLTLTQVSKKVKSDFFRMLINYSKAKGNLVAFFIELITARLLNLIVDEAFNEDKFMMYHLSMPIDVPGQSSHLSNLLEQDTPLTNNLSEHTKNVTSRQLQRIHVEYSENIPKQTSVDEEGVHTELATAVTDSSNIAPVNLEMSFAAEQSKEKSDRPGSPWASNEGLYEPLKTHKAKIPIMHNKFCKQYSIADAWLKGNIAKYQQKLSGRRSADFKFLFPCLEYSTFVFPYKETFVPIGKNHTPMCVQTQLSGLMVTLSPPLHH